MKLSECPEQYKIYIFKISNGDKFKLTGEQKAKLFAQSNNMVELDGKGFNKAHIVSWVLDYEATRENVLKHKEQIEKAIIH